MHSSSCCNTTTYQDMDLGEMSKMNIEMTKKQERGREKWGKLQNI